MKSKRRRWLKIITYNLIIVLILLSALEFAYTYFLNHPDKSPNWLLPALKAYYNKTDRSIIQYDPDCAHYSEDLFYELNEGNFHYSNREFSTNYSINSAGFRDDEKSLEFPKIITLGDSYTMGWGVEQNETFAQLIEAQTGLITLNTGVSSYGTAREIHSLRKVALDSLKYLVIQYCPNDFNENKQYYIAQDSLVVSSQERWNQAVETNAQKSGYYPFKHLISITPLIGKENADSIPPGRALRKALRPPVRISEERAFLNVLKTVHFLPKDIQIIVFSLESEKCDNYFIKALKKLLQKEHGSSFHDRISFIDLTDLIGEKERFVLDAHINAKGHKVIAEKVASHIDTLAFNNDKQYWYYDNGTLGYVCEYKNGLKDGSFICYWDNGVQSRISYFKEGKRHGSETNFDRQGRITDRKHYKNDTLSGPSLIYDTLGIVVDSTFH